MLADLQAGQGSAGKLLRDPALYDELHKTVAEIRSLVADVNAGKGTAGKLMERIASSLPETPTPASFVEAMYALKGETLGGLLPGLTYNRGEHKAVALCVDD